MVFVKTLLIFIVIFIDFYAFQSINTISKNKIVYTSYLLVSIIVIVNFIYSINNIGDSKGIGQQVMLAFGLVVLTLTPKIIALVILFGEDIFRVFKTGFNYFYKTNETQFFPDRRAVVSKLALGLASIPFTSVLYGMLAWKTHKYK